MLCPLKFGHYEFEGGQGCIGAECGMFKRCNADNANNRTIRKQNKKYRNEIAELKAKLGKMTAERDILQDCVDDLNADTSELQAKVDELISAVNELQKKQPYCYDPDKPVDTLGTVGRYIDELTAELTAARNAHAQAEHEAVILREKLGRALDYAHEITSVGGDC